ncbi:MAG: InlB B-repeat-containing protein, partial [Clostridia bacterium]|nr:InlB B-repeat-containing protein [Clostridia bacterium]
TWHDRYYDNILGVPLNRLAGDVQKINKGLTIKYDMNGGEGNITDTIKPYNEETNLTSIIPIKSGENFLGWEFDNTQYSSGMYVDASLNPCYCCDEVTFTAHYADIDAITYIADKATNVPASHENKGVLSNQVPRKTGYDFLGWDEDPNVKNPTYKAGDPISKTGDVTLYAIWEYRGGDTPEVTTYTITYDYNNGSGTTVTQEKAAGEDVVLSIYDPVYDGYTFLGWALGDDPDSVVYHTGDTYSEDADLYLYAVWEEEIDDDDGNEETEWYIVDEGMYGDNFEWSLDSYGVLSITGSGPLPEPYSLGYELAPWESYSSLVIELDIGRGITSFYPHAFEGFSNLESIYLPTSVTSLAYRCFADCTSLTTLTLPAGLNYHYSPGYWTDYGAFQGDTAICDITIIGEGQLHSEGEEYAPWKVGSDAGNEVTVKIGEGVTEIPAAAFQSCSNLVSVNIPSTVTTIGANAFNGCTGLTDVWYGSTMEKWNSISIGSGNTVLSSSGVTIHTISIDDFNGDGVTSDADALYILRYTILPVRYPLSVANADFDGNGIVNAKDAAWLKQRIN